MKKLKIGSVIRVSEWIIRNETKRICYGLVVRIDYDAKYLHHNYHGRKVEVIWGKAPNNPNLRTPRAKWFENTEKWHRCEVIRW